MIPWVVARELGDTLLDYLRSTWSLSDRRFEAALLSFLARDGGMFQGPYLRLGLPFAPAPPDAKVPLDIAPPYPPHLHQLQAWQRLSSLRQEPRATLITTGTGSGKTECFLYPLLDHALREANAGKKGIKAIVLYPMNALASDQAARFASTIFQDERLRGRLSVGLFVGGEGHHRTMGAHHVIDRNDHLRQHPPDILLTNYRMLDLLLQRPKDAPLWAQNQPDTLRYLVLDELHTYDGAQGTDVACLIRRLGQRLGLAERICPIGTSATMGTSEQTLKELLKFASVLFDQSFSADAFIGETRVAPADLLPNEASEELYPPAAGLWPEPGERAEEHVARVARAWLPEWSPPAPAEPGVDRVALGSAVLRLPIARRLLAVASGDPLTRPATIASLAEGLPAFARLATDEQDALLASALTLLSYAQRQTGAASLPLVSVQVTLWVRELRRLLVRVSTTQEFLFRFHDESPAPPDEVWLPRYACRDCGHSGWLTTETGLHDIISVEYKDIARAMQERLGTLRLLEPWAETPAGADPPTHRVAYLSPHTRRLLDRPLDGADLPKLSVYEPDDGKLACPACEARDTLIMLAARGTSLSSVAIGHLFTSPLNTDKKLLTFSDSVQDAAHRAGFFGARTYRFALRTALLAAVPRDGALPLAAIGDAVWQHWTARLGKPDVSPEAELTARLLPVDLHYLSSVEDWHERLYELTRAKQQAQESGESVPRKVPDPSPRLVADLQQRLQWEATRELGLATRIGRTLEQSGCASVSVEPERFDRAVTSLRELLREKLGATDLGDGSLRAFVGGLALRMRLRGAIDSPLLQAYVRAGGSNYMLSKEKAPLLSPFGRETSRPIWLTNARKPRQFDAIDAGTRTWLRDWVERALGLSGAQLAGDTYRLVMPALCHAGLVREIQTDEAGPLAGSKAVAWGLDPSALLVGRDPSAHRCDACGLELWGLSGTPSDPAGWPCLRFRCEGKLARSLEVGPGSGLPVPTYYKRFYERGELGRLWSREHTGLLDREAREDLELEFRTSPRPDSPNLLSCTPTLEMGIDIGDLSATLLCSVPPSASSYVQRVGRAGRKTGNALILAVAATRPHDLHFFQAPLEAMAGIIHPPGCYLRAPEVLKRQALAFAFDNYARSGKTLPPRVTDALSGDETKRFPKPMLDFIAAERHRLADRFAGMFDRDLDPNEREIARGFFLGEKGKPSQVESALQRTSTETGDQREELRSLIRRLDDRAREINAAAEQNKLGPEVEEEKAALQDERKFLRARFKQLTEQDFFGWLTEAGVLPNYAFPERGVRLDAYIRREGVGREPEHHGWVRPPASALTELAPFNTFYASARRVQIDGVDLKKEVPPVEWVFCRNCHHGEPALKTKPGQETCPSCGDPRWSDVGQKRHIAELRQVFAASSRRDAVVDDDADQRRKKLYERIKLFDAGSAATDAWANEEKGFGFELQSRMTMRQINLGPGEDRAGTARVSFAGKSVPDVAFTLCPTCGHAAPPTNARGPTRAHRVWCQEAKKPVAAQPQLKLHLLREISSEALRLVVPVSHGLEVDADVANLRAALRLGLQRLYGGDPDFLEVHDYDEPLAAGEGRRRFLVVMDRVPGGTGMLAELAKSKGEKLLAALGLSRDTLASCSCGDRVPEVRGCYQCVYAYREGDDLPKLERKRALKLTTELLLASKTMAKVDSIGSMAQSGVLESELEHRFIAELRKRIEDSGGAFEELAEGKYALTVGKRRWRGEGQVPLGADEVPFPCRADFVFYPEESEPPARPVAVFTDGLAFHVKPGESRGGLADDARKRHGITQGGRLLSWSLTWKDVVPEALAPVPRWVGNQSDVDNLGSVADKLDQTRAAGGESLRALIPVLDDPLSGLVAYLAAPTRLEELARVVSMSLLSRGKRRPDAEVASAQLMLRSSAEATLPPLLESSGERAVAAALIGEYAQLLVDHDGRTLSKLSRSADDLRVTLRLADADTDRTHPAFEASWRRWLHAWNLLQVLPDAVLVTREGLLEETAAPASLRNPTVTASPSQTDSRLRIAEEIGDEHLRAAVVELLAAFPELPAPQVPFELRRPVWNGDRDVELAWPDRKVAAYFEHEQPMAALLQAAGWVTIEIDRRPSAVDLARALGLKVEG